MRCRWSRLSGIALSMTLVACSGCYFTRSVHRMGIDEVTLFSQRVRVQEDGRLAIEAHLLRGPAFPLANGNGERFLRNILVPREQVSQGIEAYFRHWSHVPAARDRTIFLSVVIGDGPEEARWYPSNFDRRDVTEADRPEESLEWPPLPAPHRGEIPDEGPIRYPYLGGQVRLLIGDIAFADGTDEIVHRRHHAYQALLPLAWILDLATLPVQFVRLLRAP